MRQKTAFTHWIAKQNKSNGRSRIANRSDPLQKVI